MASARRFASMISPKKTTLTRVDHAKQTPTTSASCVVYLRLGDKSNSGDTRLTFASGFYESVMDDLARRNAAANGLDACAFEEADVSAWLKASDARYDVVVCDPPKLAPSAKTLPRATRKYQKINALALGAVKRGGLLLTCTCSSAMTTSGNFLGVVHDAALDAGRQVTVLRTSGAAADHPIHPAFAEGAYLTAVLLHVH